MVKPATVNRIRTLSRQGKSANEIIRQLRREHRGIRRTTALTYVREFKGKAPKKEVYKYTPRKYRRYNIAVYGKVKGKSHRIEARGKKKELYSLICEAIKHPPKERFARIDANRISERGKLDYRKEWDARPKIVS